MLRAAVIGRVESVAPAATANAYSRSMGEAPARSETQAPLMRRLDRETELAEPLTGLNGLAECRTGSF